MKILHLIYTNGISGAEKYLKHLLPGLKNEGIDCDLIIICGKTASSQLQQYAQELEVLGISCKLLVASRSSFIVTAFKISRYCRLKNIRIIHSHLINSDIIAVMAKKFFMRNAFLISSKHGYDEKVLQVYEPGKAVQRRGLYYHVTKYTMRYIDKNIAVSKAIAELYEALGLGEGKFQVIYHGVTLPAFDAKAYASTCRLAEKQLIIVGRIEKFKGHHFLIDAMVQVVKQYPGCKLLVLGEGSARAGLAHKVAALNLDSNIVFMGFQPHPYSFISNSDIIVLPSLFEPFGLVYIEAFALKVPVVAFDTPAGNELMQNDRTALMAPKGDINALAEKIIYLLDHEEARSEIAAEAYKVYLEKFTTETMIRSTAAWYRSLSSEINLKPRLH